MVGFGFVGVIDFLSAIKNALISFFSILGDFFSALGDVNDFSDSNLSNT